MKTKTSFSLLALLAICWGVRAQTSLVEISSVSPPVTQLLAGSGVSLSPSDRHGVVTITVSAGGGLPSQTGNSGKFLTTDGSAASCSLVPLATGVSGTLPIANGGTGATSFTNG